MRRAHSEYVFMHVCMFEAPKHVCMFEIAKCCLSMYVCLQACLYACMFETLNYHPELELDSLQKMFSI